MKKLSELTPEEFTLPPLHQAARQRDLAALNELLGQGHDPNELDERHDNGDGGNAPLWYTAQGLPGEGVPIAERLIQAGARVNEPGEHQMTALHMACSWGHADMVRCLCENGADLALRDKWGRTVEALARADYAEGQGTAIENRPAGWDGWFNGIAAAVAYFDSLPVAR